MGSSAALPSHRLNITESARIEGMGLWFSRMAGLMFVETGFVTMERSGFLLEIRVRARIRRMLSGGIILI
jgi:hypothetical protein